MLMSGTNTLTPSIVSVLLFFLSEIHLLQRIWFSRLELNMSIVKFEAVEENILTIVRSISTEFCPLKRSQYNYFFVNDGIYALGP